MLTSNAIILGELLFKLDDDKGDSDSLGIFEVSTFSYYHSSGNG